MTRLLPALFLAAALAGCAADTRYPSLQPRAAEKLGFEEPAPPAATSIAPDPALDQQVAEFAARLRTITSSFDTAAAEADRKAAAARGRAAGSEAWLEAQTALAALDDWRAQASSLATDVEQLGLARAATLAPPYPSLAALAERSEAEAQRQAATIARVQAMLAPA